MILTAINYFSLMVIPLFLLFVVSYGVFKQVAVYDSFILGAKGGLQVVLRIFPYLLGIFVAIKVFQASGAFDLIATGLKPICLRLGIPVDVISIMLIKPLSGSASTGVFTNIVQTTGPDSLASRISAVIMGSAETTFYVLAVYLGAVGIRKTGYLIPLCILGELICFAIAIVVVKLIF